jgi:hypothetical protein
MQAKMVTFLKYVLAAALASITPAALQELGAPATLHALIMAGIGAALIHLRTPGTAKPKSLEAEYATGYADGQSDASEGIDASPESRS